MIGIAECIKYLINKVDIIFRRPHTWLLVRYKYRVSMDGVLIDTFIYDVVPYGAAIEGYEICKEYSSFAKAANESVVKNVGMKRQVVSYMEKSFLSGSDFYKAYLDISKKLSSAIDKNTV